VDEEVKGEEKIRIRKEERGKGKKSPLLWIISK